MTDTTPRELIAILTRAGLDELTAQHALDEIGDPTASERELMAHHLWTFDARLNHSECINDPKLGNDAYYENGCETCEEYLLVVADSLIAAAALEAALAENDRLREVIAEACVQVEAARAIVTENLVLPDAADGINLMIRGLDPILAKAAQS